MDLLTALDRVGACGGAKAWLVAERKRRPGATRSQERWDACPRGDWLLWLADRAGVDRKLLALAACACARLSLRYVPAGEDQPRLCIEVTERWCRGEATLKEVRAARDACWSARLAPHVYAYADRCWAYTAAAYADRCWAYTAAAYAADTASSASLAAYAADTASSAALAADAAARAADDPAGLAASGECADAVRAVIPWATVERGLYLAAGGVL